MQKNAPILGAKSNFCLMKTTALNRFNRDFIEKSRCIIAAFH